MSLTLRRRLSDPERSRPIRVIQTLGSDSIGSVVALSILRAGEPTDLQLTIGERPQT